LTEGCALKFRQTLREPLVHFLALGLGLFLLHAIVAPPDSGGGKIVITQAKISSLAQQYQTTWNRPPTPVELQRLIDADVKNQILYREGKLLGLDRDDAVIERRVRQKYELISEEEGTGQPPSDADLSSYLASHPEKFRRPPVLSLDQIFFEVKGSDAFIDARIAASRAALARGAIPASLGDATMLPRHVDATSLDLVARDFGEKFATAVGAAPVGAWGPPVLSGYGIHLVRVTDRAAAALPPLAAIRAEVAREWENDRRVAASEASFQRAKAKYDVVIEGRK
jgi:hypothetical protein